MPEPYSPDHSQSVAVLVGTSDYTNLPSLRPAAQNSLDRMVRLLTSDVCGWPKDRLTVLANEKKPGDLPDRLVQAFAEAEHVALFYYVGHGQIDDEDRLCLGLVDSVPDAARRVTTSLPFDAVRSALRNSDAATKIVILDCCFAGIATRGDGRLAEAPVTTALRSQVGVYIMAASGEYSTAWFEREDASPRPHTYFTKHLAEIVEQGVHGEPADLTLNRIFVELSNRLVREKKPVPTRWNRDLADQFAFARNVAAEDRPAERPIEWHNASELDSVPNMLIARYPLILTIIGGLVASIFAVAQQALPVSPTRPDLVVAAAVFLAYPVLVFAAVRSGTLTFNGIMYDVSPGLLGPYMLTGSSAALIGHVAFMPFPIWLKWLFAAGDVLLVLSVTWSNIFRPTYWRLHNGVLRTPATSFEDELDGILADSGYATLRTAPEGPLIKLGYRRARLSQPRRMNFECTTCPHCVILSALRKLDRMPGHEQIHARYLTCLQRRRVPSVRLRPRRASLKYRIRSTTPWISLRHACLEHR